MIRGLPSLVPLMCLVIACAPVTRDVTPVPPPSNDVTPMAAPSNDVTPVPPPSVDVTPMAAPSNACAGFHLTVQNNDTTALLVNLNRVTYATLEPGQSETLVQFLTPGVPPMPWAMSIVNASDLSHRMSATLTAGMSDRVITVSTNMLATGLGSCRRDTLSRWVHAPTNLRGTA